MAMGFRKKCLVGSSLFAVFIAYQFMLIPVPSGTKQPYKLRAVLSLFGTVNGVGRTLEALGIMPHMELLKGFVDMAPLNMEPDEVFTIEDTTFDGVSVRIYKPKKSIQDRSPGLVFYHGGGWVVGSIAGYDALIRHYAKNLNMVIVSVGYRLAPEFTFPTQFDDCFEATKYFLNHAQKFGVDSSKVAIIGDSAGGNLAASVAIKLSEDKTLPKIRLQVLLYPATQGLDFNTPSYQQNANDPVLKKQLMVEFWNYYYSGNSNYASQMMTNNHTSKSAKLNIQSKIVNIDDIPKNMVPSTYKPKRQDFGNKELWGKLKTTFTNPYFAPLLASDVSKVAPAFVYTAESDVLRDDGVLYVNKLKKAGVSVEHFHHMQGYHGIASSVTDSFEGQLVTDKIFSAIKTTLTK